MRVVVELTVDTEYWSQAEYLVRENLRSKMAYGISIVELLPFEDHLQNLQKRGIIERYKIWSSDHPEKCPRNA